MNLKFKSKKLKRYDKRAISIHKFDKIMFLSCIRIAQNKYELTYLLDYQFSLNEIISLIPIKVIIPYEDYRKVVKFKFGVWLKLNDFLLFKQNFLYIYQNQNDKRLIFKTTRHDNTLPHGFINQYNHELIFKGNLTSNSIIEYLG